MGTTISPFRYLQLARYILQKWLDTPPTISAIRKGKARALPHPRHISAQSGILRASIEERRVLAGVEPSPRIPVAGPSARREPLRPDPRLPPEPSEIYRLMNDERLLVTGAAKPPREIVVLCHGLYGFSTATPIPLFPSLKLHYWASVLEVLRDRMGVKVVVVGVKGTGSVKERAEQMHAFLSERLPKGVGVNFVAHSMGGLDCRHLISTIKPTTYTPLSLTTIGTPHRGSPFMDWCSANIGVGSAAAVATAAMAASSAKVAAALPFSLRSPLLTLPDDQPKENSSLYGFTSALSRYLLNIFDSPAYSNLTTHFLRDHFNPATANLDSVKYTSVAGRTTKMSVLHPLWFPKLVLDGAAEKGYAEDHGRSGKEYEGNDGLVSVTSAKWGEFIGAVDPCHHWDLRGEGGLFPNGGTTSHKPEGKPDQSVPGGWDWQGGLGRGVGEYLGLGGGGETKSTADQASELKQERESGKAGTSTGSTWDIAQVGQVLDWVTDLLPGGESIETGRKQLADAVREKEKEERGGKDGEEARRDRKEGEERDRERRDKFDLAKFYGGLMLKLREDGF